MADALPIDSGSMALAARLGAPEQRLLLAGLVEHDASGWIPDVHLDDCEDDACRGCDPQHLAEQGADMWSNHHKHCYIREGHDCSCGGAR
ncbi:hypothetical protein [Streptomyces sp. NPDC096033]|uniref:hypothetical protein n=1 Tax=Streptomyces sp. NPDC096033 TaxID=3366071 RepID=UPI0038247532